MSESQISNCSPKKSNPPPPPEWGERATLETNGLKYAKL